MGWEKNIIGKESNRDNESNKAAVNNSFPPYSLPFTVSLLISGSLFFDIYSPASTLIIPFIRKNVPFGYFIIILMEFITALMVKWSSAPYSYSILPGPWNTAIPSLEDLRGIYRGLEEATPLLPISGLTFNISFGSPFSGPNSRAATLYTIELKAIRNIPGYIVPLATLILYFFLRIIKSQ
ncbi:MAG: hypothetical protein GX248_03420 [Peptococcaceae bacterium]|nr:hypothetical protein [Peptococcaceae bacterium]